MVDEAIDLPERRWAMITGNPIRWPRNGGIGPLRCSQRAQRAPVADVATGALFGALIGCSVEAHRLNGHRGGRVDETGTDDRHPLPFGGGHGDEQGSVIRDG